MTSPLLSVGLESLPLRLVPVTVLLVALGPKLVDLRRRTSFSSMAGTSDMGSLSQYDYKSQDDGTDLDDMKSQYTGTQSGVTVF